MKKFKYIMGIMMLTGGFTFAQTELDTYLKIGAENNYGLKSIFSEYNAALQRIPQVGALPDPTVSFGYFISPIETRVGPQRAKLGINQMFPWFGILNAKEEVAAQIAKAKYEAFEEAKSMLFFEIKSAYFNLYFIEKGIDITEENIRILNTFLQLSIIKIETGKASVVDELRVEMEINELKNQLAFLRDSKDELTIKFKNLLNSPDSIPITVPDSLWNDDLFASKATIIDSINSQNHMIKQLDHKILSLDNQEIVAKKMGLPQFSIGVDYAFIGESANQNLGSINGRDAFMLPKVGISIPIYRKKYSAMVNEVGFKKEAIEFGKQEKQNRLTSLFEKGYKNYSDAQRRIELYARQLKLAKKSLNILLTAYSSDGKNFEEVLRMERKVLKYALELDKARTDKNASVAFINYLMGK